MKRASWFARIGVCLLVLSYVTPLLWGQAEKKPAILIVRIAPDALLEIGGVLTNKTGALRRFESPAIAVNQRYSYTLRATWMESGQERHAFRKAYFLGGAEVEVDLRTPDRPQMTDRERLAQKPQPARRPLRPPPLVEEYLQKGQLAKGQTVLLERLKRSPKDDQARFGLGMLQFVRAVEHLGQSLFRYGLRSDRGQQLNIPFLRLPVPVNPRPDVCTYAAVRKLFEDLIADLQKAEDTLAGVKDEQIKLPLYPGEIRLDFIGDGKSSDRFSTILNRYLGGGRNLALDESLLVVFDRGDVAWLRGYCHLLMALAEVYLAHDSQDLFDGAGFIFFANAETPHKFLKTIGEEPRGGFFDVGGANLLDIAALIHLVRLPVKEPLRMKTALTHLQKVMALSKESWKFILAETDDDYEWIPNPQQRGSLGIRVEKRMVDSWLEFVEEGEAILAGKRLIPFWRGEEKRGINLRRVFTEPRPFDLVLWVQGTAATPYLEEGTLTRAEVWTRLQRVFGGDFLGFAVWFN